jgi:hypothetical protein
LAALQVTVADELVAVEGGFLQQVRGIQHGGALVDRAQQDAAVAPRDVVHVGPWVAQSPGKAAVSRTVDGPSSGNIK